MFDILSFERTPEFLQCLRRMLINAPIKWSNSDDWESLSEIEQRATQRLLGAGLLTFRIAVEFKWERQHRLLNMTWSRTCGRDSSVFEVTGPGAVQHITFLMLDRNGLIKNGKTVAKHTLRIRDDYFGFRISDEGELAKLDLISGDRSKVWYVDQCMTELQSKLRVIERFDCDKSEKTQSAKTADVTVANAQSLASIGDVNVHVTPNIHIQHNVSGPFKLELPEGVSVGMSQQSNGDTAGEECQALSRLINLYTDGVAHEKIRQASLVLQSDTLTVNEKLEKIDALVPFPPHVSAQQLADMLQKTKTSVLNSEWWKRNRRGRKDEDSEQRRGLHKKRTSEIDDTMNDKDE
ncbi:hypothetical protein [Planctopirus hydrillae]|nr:hypothetical protein [Planctopirus hydrillae]